jgi:SPP1 gp7 family putative phage head morphogenesis protein
MPKPDRTLWKPRRRIEQSFANEMIDLMGRQFFPHLRNWIPSLTVPLIDFDIEEYALSIASRMVQSVSIANAKSWRQAALQAGGQRIYRALQQEMHGPVGQEARRLIRENAQLISSLPRDVAESTSRFVAAQQRKGLRSEEIAEQLRARIPQLTENRIHLIARTETAKAETAFSQVRAENLGIRWYEWVSAKDQRVRKSHQKMNEVLVAWANPPAPEALVHERSNLGHYAPGGCPNCRCVAIPLVRLDEVSWPHRVYVNSTIVWMTRADFTRMLPGVRRAA